MQTAEKMETRARLEAKEKAEKLAARLNKDKIKEVFYNAKTKESLLVTYRLTKRYVHCLIEYKNPNGLMFNYAKYEFLNKAGAIPLCFSYTLGSLFFDYETNNHALKRFRNEYGNWSYFLSRGNMLSDAYTFLKANGFELIFETKLGD